ncbi:tRNA (adenine57-N1/adenine58-N1)-methyltransferase [Desulfomicrobium macestii]|uniref:tRNA (adenine(58)-N(1))-methyltransferase TrmI n=2 Tax=Desulfomicrobium TaxID=898 RepID=A0A8G2C4D7_DESNO|nr:MULTISPECIES: tRNA (adenine-N1)-methyltransferase [Desulfomicrobium]MBE1424679.1 tRNA (adenine57-N1/adenine58-N1)-methyltransferase [Desulfomicrobium macestii]SFL96108.1 tRNA (adenine57-N1/adenine58-N1)-methyltransferase [Desulfomicrobium norvegicum]
MLEPGQLVMLLNANDKRYFVTAQEGQVMHTNEGLLHLDEVRAAGWGQQVMTHKGYPFTVMRPTLYDLVKSVKRRTQIIYPKEIGYIVMKLGIGPGCRIVEAGCGSGGLTTALAWLVGDTGKVYTYERREEFYTLCRQNLERIGLSHRVEQFHHDIAEGFQPHAADALFLDVREPCDYIHHIPNAVVPGAPVGFLLPTTNQVQDLLKSLQDGPFRQIEVVEIFLRHYKPVPERLRPEDRMVAHTGFLVFARTFAQLDTPETEEPQALPQEDMPQEPLTED